MIIKQIIPLLLLLIILAIVVGWYVYFFFTICTTSKKAPYVPSFTRQLRLMKEHLKIKANTTMVDLGCGDGKALRFFMKNYHLKSCEGFDIHWFAITYGRIINKIGGYKNIKLFRKNFFKADLKKYDYIYLYLWSTQLAFMEDWIFSSIKKETIIISNSFVFKHHKPFQIIKNKWGKDAIFLYKK